MDKPHLGDLLYVRGILKKRFAYVCEWEAMKLLEDAHGKGWSKDDLKDIAIAAKNWTEWKQIMVVCIERGTGCIEVLPGGIAWT